ncbi:MAG: hypothetical protein ACE5PV_15385 [Candidatus Poribacteria bacterium]
MMRVALPLAIVVLLAAGLSIGWFALADRGGAPHDGGCTSYCARAVLVNLNGGDANFDGKVQSCLAETKCNKTLDEGGNPICPIEDSDGDGTPDRCDSNPDSPTYCKLMHGQDTH